MSSKSHSLLFSGLLTDLLSWTLAIRVQRTAILNVVGLTTRLIGSRTPCIQAFLERNELALIDPVLPAVTCSAQATYLTGALPDRHGIVGNGWYDRDYCEHRFWPQSEKLIQAQPFWEQLRDEDPSYTCAKIFWWYNMYSSADYSVTPRPLYPADGRKVFDIHTNPMGMREKIKADLGPFPFTHFWGPLASILSTQWIAELAKWIEDKHWPSLSLVYLPHLDYDLQRYGLEGPHLDTCLAEIDAVVGDLIAFYEKRSIKPILLSEYGITNVSRPVHLNRVLRARGWIQVKDELGKETLDLGGSRVFAIADHQLAHVYLNDLSLLDEVRGELERTPGVAEVLGPMEKSYAGLDHPRGGDLIVVAEAESWFTYYYWLDERKAPDFARCIDIHRKYGYDPAELFFDPAFKHPKRRVAMKILRSKLGMRSLLNVIPTSAEMVKGSHGAPPSDRHDWPVLIGDFPDFPRSREVAAKDVRRHLQEHCGRGQGYGQVDLL